MEMIKNSREICGASGPNERSAASIRKIQLVTIGWMTVELLGSLVAGIRAHSVALIAFAGDSGIELLSALVVLWRFRLGAQTEKTAARVNAGLLYALAAYIVITSAITLSGKGVQPESSLMGIALLLAAAIVMPLLGAVKKRLATVTRSGALKAEAAQSNLCAYMSWIALAGLGINAIWHFPLADSVAALLLLPLIIREANEARKGEACGC